MSEQLSIFEPPRGANDAPLLRSDPPRARREDPPTSRLAAAEAGDLARAHEALILAALDEADGNIYQLAARTGLTRVQVARRMKRLETIGRAATTDETRVSPGGRPCRVWARA